MAAERRYAEGTETSISSSQAEIGRIVERYGASGFMMGWQGADAMVSFVAHGRQVRFVIRLLTDPDEHSLAVTRQGRRRTPGQRQSAMEQENRRLWRALTLAIKAKFEVVASEIATFEEEFMAHIVLPDGRTVAEHVSPAIEESYSTGGPMLLQLEGGSR